jgi:hypothetical protein
VGLQSRSGRGGEEKNSQPLPGIEILRVNDVIGKGEVVAVLNQAPLHEDIWGSGGITLRIL